MDGLMHFKSVLLSPGEERVCYWPAVQTPARPAKYFHSPRCSRGQQQVPGLIISWGGRRPSLSLLRLRFIQDSLACRGVLGQSYVTLRWCATSEIRLKECVAIRMMFKVIAFPRRRRWYRFLIYFIKFCGRKKVSTVNNFLVVKVKSTSLVFKFLVKNSKF